MKRGVTMIAILLFSVLFICTLIYIGSNLNNNQLNMSHQHNVLIKEKKSFRGKQYSEDALMVTTSDEGNHSVKSNNTLDIIGKPDLDNVPIVNELKIEEIHRNEDNVTNIETLSVPPPLPSDLSNNELNINGGKQETIIPSDEPTASPTIIPTKAPSQPKAIDILLTTSRSTELPLLLNIRSDQQSCISFGNSLPVSVDDGAEVALNGNEVVKLVKTALNDGEVFNSTSLMDPLKAVGDAISRHMVLENMSFFMEVSSYISPSSSIAYAIASTYPDMIALYIHSASTHDSAVGEVSPTEGLMVDIADTAVCHPEEVSFLMAPDPINYYVLQNHAAFLPATASADAASGDKARMVHQYPCVQYIDDLSSFVNRLLPFEYEVYLQNILCRCKYTYISSELPLTSAGVGYFSYWESMDNLITSLNAHSSDSCTLEYSKDSAANKYIQHVHQPFAVIERVDELSEKGHDGIGLGTLFSALPLQSHVSRLVDKLVAAPSTDISPERISNWISQIQSNDMKNSDANVTEAGYSWLNSFLLRGDNTVKVIPSPYSSVWMSESSSSALVDVAPSLSEYPRSRYSHVWSSSRKLLGATFGSSGDSATLSPVTTSLASSSTSSTSSASTSTSYTSSYKTASKELFVEVASLSSIQRQRYKEFKKRTENVVMQTSNHVVSPIGVGNQPNHYITEEIESEKNDRKREGVRYDTRQKKSAYWLDWPCSESTENWLVKKRYLPTYEASTSTNSIDDDSRRQQLLLHKKESVVYNRWMTLLKGRYGNSSQGNLLYPINDFVRARLVYVSGRQISMMSIKFAKMLQSETERNLQSNKTVTSVGSVVSILSDSSSLKSHEYLLDSLSIHNNLLCASSMHALQLQALSRSPEVASVAVYQLDVIMNLFTMVWYDKSTTDQLSCTEMNSKLESLLSVLVCSAEIVYLELPVVNRLLSVLYGLYATQTTSSNSDRLLQCVRCIQNFEGVATSDADVPVKYAVQLIQNVLNRLQRNEQIQYRVTELQSGDNRKSIILRVSPNKSVRAMNSRVANRGISLYSLMHLGVSSTTKRKLLKMLINFPLWSLHQEAEDAKLRGGSVKDEDIDNDLLPWNLFVNHQVSSLVSKKAKLYRNVDKVEASHSSNEIRYEINLAYVPSNKDSSFAPTIIKIASVVDASATSSRYASEQADANMGFSILMNEFNSHRGELAGGKFSFVEHNSGFGYLSMLIANKYPNATVLSLEDSEVNVRRHAFAANSLNITNNYIALTSGGRYSKNSRSTILKNLYDSPELFRYQVISKGLFEAFESSGNDRSSASEELDNTGTLLSLALTSYVKVPSSAQVSWAMKLLHQVGYAQLSENNGDSSSRILRDPLHKYLMLPIRPSLNTKLSKQDDTIRNPSKSIKVSSHPTPEYEDFETYWLLGNVKLPKMSSGTVSYSSSNKDDDSNTKLVVNPLYLNNKRVPWIRCDIVNMTRHVHHHYDYSKDGHTRTYTMHIGINRSITQQVNDALKGGDPSHLLSTQHPNGILLSSKPVGNVDTNSIPFRSLHLAPVVIKEGEVLGEDDHSKQLLAQRNQDERKRVLDYETKLRNNSLPLLLPAGYHPIQHQLTGVHLHRDRDGFPIPYVSVYGITLITAQRLGIIEEQIGKLYEKFLQLPLYEDMAPWNIVLMGNSVDYIDYDTKDMYYDMDIPKAYQIMTVLMNYKRTVEDFKKCGSKGSTVYGLPYASDCVGSTSNKKISMPTSCPDLKYPVPCGDGTCHSDYISCLRSYAKLLPSIEEDADVDFVTAELQRKLKKRVSISEALKSGIASFNEKGLN